MKKIAYFLVLSLIVLQFDACIPFKDLKYIQPDSRLQLDSNGIIKENRPVYHIQNNDMINILIAYEGENNYQMFRSFIDQTYRAGNGGQNNNNGNNGAGGAGGAGGGQGQGVRVNENGDIELPRIGKIHLEGLTIEEAKEKVKTAFYKIYTPESTFIDVYKGNINFTVVGEAGNGTYASNRYDLNILEALAMTGINNVYADKKHIRIIRTTPQGTQQVEVDVTQESVMNSEYFWIQPNDLIVVNPLRQKQWGLGTSPLTTLTTIFGAITTVIGMYLFFDKL